MSQTRRGCRPLSRKILVRRTISFRTIGARCIMIGSMSYSAIASPISRYSRYEPLRAFAAAIILPLGYGLMVEPWGA
jgi:hypothetical protein